MTEKIRKMLVLTLAFVMLMFVFVPSFAEDVSEETEEFEDDELYTFDDDYCGYADSDLIADHTPEMTEELIFADDWSEAVEANEALKAEAAAKAEPEEVPDEEESEEVLPEAVEPEEVPEQEETGDAEPEAEPETEEPVTVQETEEEPGSDDDDADTAEETEAAADAEENRISVSVQAVMVSDDEMMLSAVVNGENETAITFQWQISEDGGKHYEDITDATSDELQVLLTDQNKNSMWRVKVETV